MSTTLVNKTHAADNPRMIENLPFQLDQGIASRAAIGFIVLGSDYTMEYELRDLLNIDGVAWYHSRIQNDPIITPDSLRDMEGRLTHTTDIMLPGYPMDVIAFGCTSASMAIGEERVFECINAARPAAKCTTPITAAQAAFKAFGANRIGVLTPYRSDVNMIVADYLAKRGIEIPIFGSFNEEDDANVARIDKKSLENGIARLIAEAAFDALFVSCTSTRIAAWIAELEERFQIPITSSNHALAWHCLRLAGINEPIRGKGKLFEF